MCPRIIRALLCAATARAAAATSHVVDDFNTTEGMFTLTSQVPPVSTTEVTETSDGVRLDYSSHHLEMYSGFPYAGRLLGQGNYPCAEASYLKLEYRILQAPARPGVARLVMAVGDASECGLDAPLPRICATAGVQGFADRETYASILDGVLDDTSGDWRTLKLGLCGDSDPNSPFMRLAGFGPVGNAKLDRKKIDAYRFTVVVPHYLRDTVEGAIELRSLTCIDDGAPGDRCAVDSGHDEEARASCEKIEGVRFQTSKAYERVEWGYQSCCELCARDQRCLYFAVDTTFVPLALEYPSCYLFDHVELERPPWLDVTPPAGEAFVVEAFWVKDAAKQGTLCERCACGIDGAADCRGRDLATVPAPSKGFNASSIDLSDNPRLVFIGKGALCKSHPHVVRLALSDGVYLDPDALRDLPDELEVDVVNGVPPKAGNFIVDAGDAFDSVCCSRGATIAGLTFCEKGSDEPWADATFERLEEDAWQARYGDLPPFEVLVAGSFFLAEAAESAEKCAAICARTQFPAKCAAYSWQSPPDIVIGGTKCLLHGAAPTEAVATCVEIKFTVATSDEGTWTAGYSPQTRAARGARVVVEPGRLVLDEGNSWTGTVDVSLGARPLRGAVWATPRAKDTAGLDVAFSPQRVVLYDDETSVTLTVVAVGVEEDSEFVVDLDLEACDLAFLVDLSTTSVTVGVREKDDDSNKKAKRRLRQLRVRIAIGVVVSLAVVSLLIGISAVRKRKKRGLPHAASDDASRSTHSSDAFVPPPPMIRAR